MQVTKPEEPKSRKAPTLEDLEKKHEELKNRLQNASQNPLGSIAHLQPRSHPPLPAMPAIVPPAPAAATLPSYNSAYGQDPMAASMAARMMSPYLGMGGM